MIYIILVQNFCQVRHLDGVALARLDRPYVLQMIQIASLGQLEIGRKQIQIGIKLISKVILV